MFQPSYSYDTPFVRVQFEGEVHQKEKDNKDTAGAEEGEELYDVVVAQKCFVFRNEAYIYARNSPRSTPTGNTRKYLLENLFTII